MGGGGCVWERDSSLPVPHLPQPPARLRPLFVWVELRQLRAQSGGLHKEVGLVLLVGGLTRGAAPPPPHREEMSERYERAAAVSVFRGNMRRGIMILTDGANLARQQGNEERCT